MHGKVHTHTLAHMHTHARTHTHTHYYIYCYISTYNKLFVNYVVNIILLYWLNLGDPKKKYVVGE